MAESYSSSLNSKLKIMKLNSYTLCFTTTAATALCFLLDSVASAPPRPNTIPDPLYTNKTQGDSKNYDGPFSLEFAKSWNASVNTDDSIEPLGNGNIVSKPGYKIMTGDNNNNGIINQYLIFYGLNSTSNTTTPRINLAKNLFSNIGATAFWTLVQEYEYSGMLPGKPAFNTSIAVPSIMNSIYGLNGSQLVRSDESRILSYLIDTKALPKDEFGIYTIFLDNSINYKVNGSILGDNFCGLHGIAENSTFGISNTSYGLSYTTVGIPNPTGKCAISYKLGLNQTANKDIAFDNALTIAIHELVEAVLNMPMYSSNNSLVYNGGSAFEDSIGYGPADKCENRYVNLDAKKTNSTLKIGSYNYLISPIWDIRRNKCSLGKSWKSAGCFIDSSDRILNGVSDTSGNYNTVEKCQQFCASQGFTLIGVEYTKECYCDNGSTDGFTPATTCNAPCDGNGKQMCGGFNWEISVYKFGVVNGTGSSSWTAIDDQRAPGVTSTYCNDGDGVTITYQVVSSGNSVSSTKTTTSSSSPTQLSSSCVSGTFQCNGSGYLLCSNGQWVNFACGPGTQCVQISSLQVLCGFPSQSTTSSSTTSKSSPTQSSSSCVSGNYQCNGSGYQQCSNGQWFNFACGTGTQCVQISSLQVLCEVPSQSTSSSQGSSDQSSSSSNSNSGNVAGSSCSSFGSYLCSNGQQYVCNYNTPGSIALTWGTAGRSC